MMNGLAVKRGEMFLARRGAKNAKPDASGAFWSKDPKAARVFMNHDIACRTAKRYGGVVRLMRSEQAEGEKK